jgi:hypothetical protein
VPPGPRVPLSLYFRRVGRPPAALVRSYGGGQHHPVTPTSCCPQRTGAVPPGPSGMAKWYGETRALTDPFLATSRTGCLVCLASESRRSPCAWARVCSTGIGKHGVHHMAILQQSRRHKRLNVPYDLDGEGREDFLPATTRRLRCAVACPAI